MALQQTVGALSPEPVTGDQNSITQYFRSLENLTGEQGQGAFTSGQRTYASGVGAVAPSLDYLTKLVRGDSADVSQVMAPEIDAITGQFDAARKLIAAQPRGGGKASVLAEAPYKKAEAISNMKSQARTAAVGQLGQLGATLAGEGLQESSLGAQQLGQTENFLLGIRGQDFGDNFASNFQKITSAINNLI